MFDSFNHYNLMDIKIDILYNIIRVETNITFHYG